MTGFSILAIHLAFLLILLFGTQSSLAEEKAKAAEGITQCVVQNLSNLAKPIEEIEKTLDKTEVVNKFPELRAIEELKSPHDRIPEEILMKFDSKEIAEVLVNRLHSYGDNISSSEAPVAISPRSDRVVVQMSIPGDDPELIKDILKGGFKNQHQTHKGGALYLPEKRANKEDRIIWLSLSESITPETQAKINEIRPKYAEISINDLTEKEAEAIGPVEGARFHGAISVVFQNGVKKRSTFCNGDSLLGVLPIHTFSMESLPATTYRRAKTRTFSDVSRLKPSELKPIAYIETQIWGSLEKDDVDYFLIPPDTQPEVIEALKAFGRPIYTYREILQHELFYTRVKDKILFPGQ